MAPWLTLPSDTDFSIHNLPYGMFSTAERTVRPGIAIGEQIVDLPYWFDKWGQSFCTSAGVHPDSLPKLTTALESDVLNDFIALGKEVTVPFRKAVQKWLCDFSAIDHEALVSMDDATLHMPIRVGDYTDFYSSIEHATNVGKMFRDPENALLPNWRHLPVGYHGRASSIIPSGVPIRRPNGQTMPKDADKPVYGPSQRLDFELEMAFIVGKNNEMGESITTEQFADYCFGFVLFNDWSARDIQKWEYVPLGPFLGKSFASSISPWIVTLEALDPFKVPGPVQEPEVLDYLKYTGQYNYDIGLEVHIQPAGGSPTRVSTSNYKYMYWNGAQQLAHHSVNGCNMRVGDMLASGTISGPTEDSYGSMLELAWAGTKPVPLEDGSERKFIYDGDTVIMRGWAE
ncbi:MAG: fumarylacetoacetase, partial [Bacteroidota bacterium]